MNNILDELYKTILERKENPLEGSYTNYLFDKGRDKILKKVGEECTETIIAAKGDSTEDLVAEVSDLTYHLLVLLVDAGISLETIEAELVKRHQKTQNKKPERREIEQL